MRRAALLVAIALVLAASCDRSGDDRSAQPTDPTGPDPSVGADTTCSEAAREGRPGPLELADATRAQRLDEPLRGMFGHAAAVGDVDGDGWLDLFVGTFADRPDERYRHRGAEGPAPDRLLLGGPDGFTAAPGFSEQRTRTSAAVFADLDGDGDLDIVVSRNLSDERTGAPTGIFRNDGDGFEFVALPLEDFGGRGVAVLDHDGDGRLDLVIAEDRFAGGSTVLLRNEGDLRFTDATRAAGLPVGMPGLAVVAADLSGDGHTDLFVTDANRLFVGDGDGRFREADSSVFDWERHGDEDLVAGADTADLNRDGRLDLVVGHHFNSTVDDGRRVPVRVYLNRGTSAGSPRFDDVTGESGLPPLPTKAPHVEVADLDNDGWPDLVTTASADSGRRPAIFMNTGVREGVPRFESPTGIGSELYWITGSVADFDRDGRLDVFVVDHAPERPSLLLRNGGATGHLAHDGCR